MKKIVGALVTSCLSLVAQESIVPPEGIKMEPPQQRQDFVATRNSRSPWYTGPLITGSANNVPKGQSNVQPYLTLTSHYKNYTSGHKTAKIPHIFTVKPQFICQHGFTNFIDATLSLNGIFRWREGECAQGFGDTTCSIGLQLLEHTLSAPSIRLTLGEVLPTGKFRNFNPQKAAIASMGSGAFSTEFGLFFSKIFQEEGPHPIRVRLASIYSLPNHKAHVQGFNTYGGGFKTEGHVRIGHNIQVDLGVEMSMSQRWVFAFDIAYDHTFKSTFNGRCGVRSDGTPATVGSPSSNQLSLAPALEYNVSANGGFIGGVWFSVAGSNSSAFIAAALSYTHSF